MAEHRVLVLGGVGFIGRNLVVHLVENNLAKKIRVVDKAIPAISCLTERQKAAFEKVEFKQGNLSKAPSVAKAFEDAEGEFDVVINCAAMTKYGQSDAVYDENVYTLSMTCAQEAAKRKVKKFIELSTSQVYAGDKKPSAEGAKVKPWTSLARAKLRVEGELAKIEGLNYCIVRPAIVYGVSDMLGLMPRLIIGAVYKNLGETMKLLWTDKLRLNTVHVEDVARALWHLVEKGEQGAVYNLADKGDTTQETVNRMVADIFGIKFDYAGSLASNFASLNLKSVAEDVNEKHVVPWSEMCQKDGIANSPLSPFLDQELLYNNSTSVDGSFIESTGFEYKHPALDLASLREAVDEYVKMGVFPKSCFE